MSPSMIGAAPRIGMIFALLCALVLPFRTVVAQPDDKSSLPVKQIDDSSPGHVSDAAAAKAAAQPSASQIINGTGKLVRDSTPEHLSNTTVSDDGQITLNFVNADVRDVAKAVLGDFLGLNYAIGSSVQGTVTIQTSRPLGRADVLPVLEQTFRLNGLALVRTNDVYKILPVADAPREATTAMSAGTSEPGYGGEIMPLRYVSATEMMRLLEPMQPQQAIIHADPTRNVLIVEGTQGERAAVASEVALFDVDWLAGMSFAMFTPKYTDARGLAKELSQIMGGDRSPLADVVRIVPIDRLNSVLVISHQPRYLSQIGNWVERLDKPGVGTERQLYVYAVQNGRASDLAVVLKKVLYDDGKGAAKEADQNTPQPESAAAIAAPAGLPSGSLASSASAPPLSNSNLIQDSQESAPLPNGISITADEANNAVVVYSKPQDYAVIENALRKLDITPLQVLLEAVVAEVTLTNDLKYGVQYFYQPSNKHSFTLSSGGARIAPSFPGFSYLFSEGSNIKVILDTLASVTHVEVVSSPEVLVLNNRTATLQVGDQVPIATSQATSVTSADAPLVNSIQYQQTGVILTVTPRVNQGGMVAMDVSQEVSDVAETTTSGLDSPTISQRKIQSSVAVQDGETIALGGLIGNSSTKGSSGLPFLSELPVIGGLFGTKTDNTTRTELLVLITPHVVDNLDKARAVTDELRHKLPSVEVLLSNRKR